MVLYLRAVSFPVQRDASVFREFRELRPKGGTPTYIRHTPCHLYNSLIIEIDSCSKYTTMTVIYYYK